MGGRTALYETMFEDATYGIGVHDAETRRVEETNEVYRDLLRLDEETVGETTLEDLVEPVPFLEETSIATSIERAVEGDPQRRYCSPTDPDAGSGQLELSLESIEADGEDLLISRLRELGSIGSGLERLAVELTNTGVWQWDFESGEIVWNEQLEQILGLEPSDHGQTIGALRDHVVEADRDRHRERVRAAIEAGDPFVSEIRMRHEAGHTIWVELRGHPITTQSGTQLIGTMTDVTEKKDREHEVDELSTHLDIALGGASPAVWEWNMETDELHVNDRVEKLIGLEPGAFEGTFQAFVERTHPEDVPKVNEAIQRAIDYDELYETEFRIAHENGDYVWIAAHGRLDYQGSDRLIGVISDITDRKTYERELAESNDELERLTEQLEFFTSILRHDVLNGMTVIKMRAELLSDQLEGQQRQYAETILEWAETTTEITESVREVIETLTTEDENREFQPVQLSEVLEELLREHENAYQEIQFDTDLEPAVTVLADGLIDDALGNVLSNGIEHNETETLHIETVLETDGDVARLTITDDGQGIDDDRKEAIFRRGETSHAKESGSGFGLFYVDVVVDSYGGDIWVEDSETGGARFVVELPLADERGEV